mmetsp:Transcript_32270/g.74541  ORF Transcript_32270/g.74541 Transcript_32270/m.74541 type:complete len:210 (+) Transcript_32270:202-831(+)
MPSRGCRSGTCLPQPMPTSFSPHSRPGWTSCTPKILRMSAARVCGLAFRALWPPTARAWRRGCWSGFGESGPSGVWLTSVSQSLRCGPMPRTARTMAQAWTGAKHVPEEPWRRSKMAKRTRSCTRLHFAIPSWASLALPTLFSAVGTIAAMEQSTRFGTRSSRPTPPRTTSPNWPVMLKLLSAWSRHGAPSLSVWCSATRPQSTELPTS